MKTARFLPAQIWTISQADEGNTVYIRPEGSNLVLPVFVSENDIQAILVELTHILASRPMVHELLLSAINSLDGKLDRVEIYGTRNGTLLCRVCRSSFPIASLQGTTERLPARRRARNSGTFLRRDSL